MEVDEGMNSLHEHSIQQKDAYFDVNKFYINVTLNILHRTM